jgi:hypothetical protein
LEVDVEPTGRFVVVELDNGRLVVVDVVGFFAGDASEGDAFSLLASGLVTTSDFDSSPDRRVESTGVAGGASSIASTAVGIASSISAMM